MRTMWKTQPQAVPPVVVGPAAYVDPTPPSMVVVEAKVVEPAAPCRGRSHCGERNQCRLETRRACGAKPMPPRDTEGVGGGQGGLPMFALETRRVDSL